MVFPPKIDIICKQNLGQIWGTSNGSCSLSFSLDVHQTTQSLDMLIFVDHCACSNSDKLSHTTTVGPSSSPQNSVKEHER